VWDEETIFAHQWFYYPKEFDYSQLEFRYHFGDCIEEQLIEFQLKHHEVAMRPDTNNVSPVSLPEPLKVRVITRGDVSRYWLIRPLQKFLHSTIRDHPSMVAIGRPLNEDDLCRLGPLGPGESYLSGDYKSATDLLHPDLSIAAVEAISQSCGFSDRLEKLFRESLVGSTIHHEYPGKKISVNQVWGQLMGSPLSFPILCLVNVAIQAYFQEITGITPRCRLSEGRFIVNGDDVASVIFEKDYAAWKGMVADAGLKPSVGKNYLSKEFVNINSTPYCPERTVDWFGQETLQFSRVPFVNLGLLLPNSSVSRSGLETEDFSLSSSKLRDLGACSHKLVEGFDYEFRDFLMRLFLSDQETRSILKQVQDGVSWFADKRLGGCGIYASRRGLLSKGQLGFYSRVFQGKVYGIQSDSFNYARLSNRLTDCFHDHVYYGSRRGSDLRGPDISEQTWSEWMEDNSLVEGVDLVGIDTPILKPKSRHLVPYAAMCEERDIVNCPYFTMELSQEPRPFGVPSILCQV
jgi:hypothetical protein